MLMPFDGAVECALEQQIVASQDQHGGWPERADRRRHAPMRESKGELVGNRLLGGFFVIALLLGVAFGRGYVVGRDSLLPAKGRLAVPSPAASHDTAASRDLLAGHGDRPAASGGFRQGSPGQGLSSLVEPCNQESHPCSGGSISRRKTFTPRKVRPRRLRIPSFHPEKRATPAR